MMPSMEGVNGKTIPATSPSEKFQNLRASLGLQLHCIIANIKKKRSKGSPVIFPINFSHWVSHSF